MPGEVPVTAIWQLIPERLHVACENETLPVPPVWEKVIVSPEIGPVAPVTLAVQGRVAPTAREAVHDEVTVTHWVTVTLALPELPETI